MSLEKPGQPGKNVWEAADLGRVEANVHAKGIERLVSAILFVEGKGRSKLAGRTTVGISITSGG